MNLSESKTIYKILEVAYRKLSFRMRTVSEMRKIFKENDFPQEESEEAIAYLKEEKLLDDGKFSREYYLSHKPKGKADKRILSELAKKGITGEIAKEAISSMKEDAREEGFSAWGEEEKTRAMLVKSEKENALAVGEKMAVRHLSEGKEIDEKFLGRVGRRLAALGFDSSSGYYVIGKLKDKNRQKEDEFED